MLIVLDEIHNQFLKIQDVDFCKIVKYLNLKESDLISFYFLNMKSNQLPNNTYVRMNARGKSLTGFENFKASLEEYLKNTDETLYQKFRDNIDSKWLDFMFLKTKPHLPDSVFMSLFNRHFINVWNLNKKNNPDIGEKAIYDKIDSDLIAFPCIDTFISWSVYEKILNTVSIKETIQPLFNLLLTVPNSDDLIEKNINHYQKWQEWDFWGCKENDTYPAKVKYFALLFYFKDSDYQEEFFSNWVRVVFNIIENQTIDSIDSYIYALRLFSELGAHSHDIYAFLADDSNKIESGFAKDQVHEERLKAKKIRESKAWEKAIIEAEYYEILRGKINVLFKNGEKTTLDVFNERYNLLKTIYENKDDNYHIIKVLLCHYNESIPKERISLKNTEGNIKQLVTKTFAKEFQQITSDAINVSIAYNWIKELATTKLLNISRQDGKIVGKYGNRVVLWGTSGCVWKVFGNDVWGNILLGEDKRNFLLQSLGLENNCFQTDYPNEEYVFYSGWETYFKFNDNYFVWLPHDNTIECDVYLMADKWEDYIGRKKELEQKTNTEADRYFAFNATDEMIKKPELFKTALNDLIQEWKKEN